MQAQQWKLIEVVFFVVSCMGETHLPSSQIERHEARRSYWKTNNPQCFFSLGCDMKNVARIEPKPKETSINKEAEFFIISNKYFELWREKPMLYCGFTERDSFVALSHCIYYQ